MRSDVAAYDLIAPDTLREALELLASEPGRYTPLAGGTELMVALAAGRLPQKRLLSLHRIEELRFIDVTDAELTFGGTTTFTDIRRNNVVVEDLPMLAQAASWTGSIANQNRATLGGNIVNASPAADSPPALLAYEADLTLVSARGMRKIGYRDFHVGYKKTTLAADELLYSVSVPRGYRGYQSCIRKVGTRNAQAISKVALACLVRVDAGTAVDIRIGAASLQDRPMRCTAAEAALTGRRIDRDCIETACAALASEVKPIDDIRSTARYRAAVACNLLEDFLNSVAP
jgi:CO/xanthine dehydrogenase FAD-binding subunit